MPESDLSFDFTAVLENQLRSLLCACFPNTPVKPKSCALLTKPKQGGMDAARFLVNSTVGIASFIDVATLMALPKHQEDFAQTPAVWGVLRGVCCVVPFLGPSSVRGIGGYIGDSALHPLT